MRSIQTQLRIASTVHSKWKTKWDKKNNYLNTKQEPARTNCINSPLLKLANTKVSRIVEGGRSTSFLDKQVIQINKKRPKTSDKNWEIQHN